MNVLFKAIDASGGRNAGPALSDCRFVLVAEGPDYIGVQATQSPDWLCI